MMSNEMIYKALRGGSSQMKAISMHPYQQKRKFMLCPAIDLCAKIAGASG